MSQIFLLTGENDYELIAERRRWITEFTAKHGAENLSVSDASSIKYTDLIGEISSAPFLAEKRLMVLNGIPKMEKEQLQAIVEAIHPSNLLLFIEAKPDKRLSVIKELLAIATVKSFSKHTGQTLISWLIGLAKDQGVSLSSQTARYLIQTVGENQMLLSTELCKLTTYANGSEITDQHIDMLCMLSEQQAAWKLTDLLAAGKKESAIRFACELTEKGESPYAVWNILLWIVSQLTLVVAAVADGQSSPAAITKLTGASFPTARAFAPLAKRIDPKRMRNVVEHYAHTDTELKTGGFRSTVEAPEELLSIIDCSIAEVASL